MPFHDDYARITPYELIFPDLASGEERLRAIREEAERRGETEALGDPGRFLALPAVAETLHEVRDPSAGAEGVQKHSILMYHAFHFLEAERPLFLLDTAAARYLVEASWTGVGSGEAPPPPPTRAGYLQLPLHLFWIRPEEDRPPEHVDGFFWSAPGDDRIAILVASGMREDRPGLSVVPLPPVPMGEAGAWLEADVRETGRDFESTLPGGDLERLHSLEAVGEVLKLLARLFVYLDRYPDAVAEEETASEPGGSPEGEEESEAASDEPRPSCLPYRRIELDTP